MVNLVSDQTLELKPDPRSKMMYPAGIATQFFQVVLYLNFLFADDVLLTGNDKVDIKQHG